MGVARGWLEAAARRGIRGAGAALRGALVAAVLGAGAAAGPGHANEPPDWPDITCTVERQDVNAAALRLLVRLHNRGNTPAELPPGTQLVFHRDAAATEALEGLARMDRLQRSVLTVPPAGTAEALFVVPRDQWAADLCRGPQPAAAAMHLYRFSPRPQHRCVLRGLDVAAVVAAACGAAAPAPAVGASR